MRCLLHNSDKETVPPQGLPVINKPKTDEQGFIANCENDCSATVVSAGMRSRARNQ